jgi:sugar phosphate isomerase/epimerase
MRPEFGTGSTGTTPPVLVSAAQFEEQLAKGNMSAVDIVERAHRLGAAGVEFRPECFPAPAGDSSAAAAKAAIGERGMSLAYAGRSQLYATSPEGAASLLADLKMASLLGSELLRVFVGPGLGTQVGSSHAGSAVTAARERGVRLAVENYVRIPGNTVAEVWSAVEPLDPEVVGVNVDIGNYKKNGQDPLEALNQLASRVFYCHFKDIADRADGPVTTYPGDGQLPLAEIVAKLRSLGGELRVALEYPALNDDARIQAGLNFFH